MKKIAALLFLIICFNALKAQSNKITSQSHPVMTPAFADTLKKEIATIIPTDFSIKLNYKSKLSADGKLLKPLIWRETAYDTNF